MEKNNKKTTFPDFSESNRPEGNFLEKYEVLKTLRDGALSLHFAKERNLKKNDLYIIKEVNHYFTDERSKKYTDKKFREEVSSLIKLRHPNIPIVTDFSINSGKYYIVENYIKGSNLEHILKEDKEEFTEKTVVELGIQICKTLEYLHSRTPITINKDLKLSSFIINDKNRKIYLTDLGIFNIFKEQQKLPGIPVDIEIDQYKTQHFIQSDIFSLGFIFFQLLTGKVAEEKKSINLASISSEIHNISSGMAEIIKKSLDTKIRYSSVSNIIKDLICLKDNFPVLPPPIIRVLIVDDMAFMRIILRKALSKKKGFEIVGEASNGVDAVKIYKIQKPDIVMMDICMPEYTTHSNSNINAPIKKGGIDAIKDIISIDQGAKIVVCSATSNKEIVIEALKSGAKDYILKPFDFEILIKTLRKVIIS